MSQKDLTDVATETLERRRDKFTDIRAQNRREGYDDAAAEIGDKIDAIESELQSRE